MPDGFSVPGHVPASRRHAERGGETVRNEVRTAIVGETFVVPLAPREAGEVLARFVNANRDVVTPQERRGRQPREAAAQNDDRIEVIHDPPPNRFDGPRNGPSRSFFMKERVSICCLA